jgi:hypothetical protein
LTAPDPIRLVIAAHELGHAILWDNAGFTITSIRIRDTGPRTRGFVELDGGEMTSVSETRNYLAGVLAGKIAGQRMAGLSNLGPGVQSCSFDEENYRKQMKDPLAASLRDCDIRAEAERKVTAHWPRIHALAHLLAERGTLVL